MASSETRVSIRPYGEGDLWILEKTLGDPNQMVYLNGPESSERLQKRHKNFVAMSQDQKAGCMFTILADNAPAGNVGYWESGWKGQKGLEMGWFIVPEFQGRGIATIGTRMVIELLSKLKSHEFVFAFPSVDNRPSNAICKRLGFKLIEDVSSEYPAGSGRSLHVNIWRLTLP